MEIQENLELYKKEPIPYLDFLPACLKDQLISKKEEIITKLREDMIVCCKGQDYQKLIVDLCPILKEVLKLYAIPKEDYEFFLEILSQCLLSAKNLLPSEATELAQFLETFTKMKIKGKFTLDWKQAYQLLELLFNEQIRTGYHIPYSNKMPLQDYIPKIIRRLKKYFPINSGHAIFKYLKSFIGKNPNETQRHIFYLQLLIRTDKKVKEEHFKIWMEELFVLWEQKEASKTFSAIAISLLAEFAKGHNEFYWEPYIDVIIKRALSWVKEMSFSSQDSSNEALEDLEKRINRSGIVTAANLVISMINAETEAKIISMLKAIVPIIKEELQSSVSNKSKSLNALKFTYFFLYSLCLRIKHEKATKKPLKYKLSKDLLQEIVIVFSEVLQYPLYYPIKYVSDINPISLAAFMCPEMILDSFIPKLISFCGNSETMHDQPIQRLNDLISPLILSEELIPKRFYYLNQILESAIEELTFVSLEVSRLALKTIANILYFLPILTNDHLKKVYKEERKENYMEYLKRIEEHELHYHSLVNSLEKKMNLIFDKIFYHVEIQGTSTSTLSSYAKALEYFVESIFPNLSKEIAGQLFNRFIEFFNKQVQSYCLTEITTLLVGFISRLPEEVENKFLPILFRNIMKKEVSDNWSTPLGELIKEYFPNLYAKAKDYSINPYISSKDLIFYCDVLCIVLEAGSFGDVKKLETLIILLLLEVENKKYASKIFKGLLQGTTLLYPKPIPIEQQSIFKDLLNGYKIIGKFNKKDLIPEWYYPKVDKLEIIQILIETYCLSFGETAHTILTTKKSTNNLPVLNGWLRFMQGVVPSCLSILHKEGKTLGLSDAFFKDNKKLKEFFNNLRINLLTLFSKIINTVKEQGLLELTSTNLAKQLLKCTCSLLNLVVPKTSIVNKGDNSSTTKRRFNNPLIPSRVIKYSYYHIKLMNIYNKLFHKFEQYSEQVHPIIVEVIQRIPWIIEHMSKIEDIYVLQCRSIMANVSDSSNKFHKNFLNELLVKIGELIDNIKGSEHKEPTKTAVLDAYIEIAKTLLECKKMLIFEDEMIDKFFVGKFLLESGMSGKEELQKFSFGILDFLEDVLVSHIKYKPIKYPHTQPTKENIAEDKEEEIAQLKKSEEFNNLKKMKMFKLISELTKNEHKNLGFKSDTMIICVLSFIAPHYDTDAKVLKVISNAISELIFSSDNLTQGLAVSRLIEIMALRQRNEFLPTFHYPGEIEFSVKDRYTKIDAYIDKKNFGWFSPPPYIRLYPSIVEREDDELYQKICNKEWVKKSLAISLKGHDDMQENEEDEIEMIENSLWLQTILTIFEQRYTIQAELFNPVQAGFYQSLFEYYGPKPFDTFAEIYKPTDEPSKGLIMSNIELISGYLRSTKLMDETNDLVKKQTEYCFSALFELFKVCPQEALEEFNGAFIFFTNNRDPCRWSGKAIKLFEDLLNYLHSNKEQFFIWMRRILLLWDWRVRSLINKCLQMIKETDCSLLKSNKSAEYMAKCFTQILLKLCDCPIYPECDHSKIGKGIIENIKSQLSSNNSSVKLTLLFIVNEAVINKYSKNAFLPWIFEQLVPICYESVLDEDKNLKNTASSFAINIVTSEYSLTCFQVIFKVLQQFLKNDNWRLRNIATCDILSFTYINWVNAPNDISILFNPLYDSMIEVSIAASRGLIKLFMLSSKENLMKYLNAFKESYASSKENNGAIFGIIAIVKACDTIIPEWLPNELEFLSGFRSHTGELGNSVRLCFSEFWEKHKKDWESEKKKFTEKQIGLLTEYVSPYNYYA